MHKCNAFTLMELLSVMSIMAVLAAITYPVVLRVKRSAYETKCISNFHQFGIAISMYREDYGASDSGTSEQMGMPPNPWSVLPPLRCPLEGLKNATGINWGYLWTVEGEVDDAEQIWEDRVAVSGSHTTIMTDLNHDDPDNVGKFYFPHHAIGLNLDSSVIRKTQIGEPRFFGWWLPQGG